MAPVSEKPTTAVETLEYFRRSHGLASGRVCTFAPYRGANLLFSSVSGVGDGRGDSVEPVALRFLLQPGSWQS